MTNLKFGPPADDKPVTLTIELPAAVYRDLQSYAEIPTRSGGATKPIEPAKLIVPMVEHFMATNRALVKARRHAAQSVPEQPRDPDSAREADRGTDAAMRIHRPFSAPASS
ncbi:DUF2274 domain-containing protein [Bradyrhizobium sp. 14AA]